MAYVTHNTSLKCVELHVLLCCALVLLPLDKNTKWSTLRIFLYTMQVFFHLVIHKLSLQLARKKKIKTKKPIYRLVELMEAHFVICRSQDRTISSRLEMSKIGHLVELLGIGCNQLLKIGT